ncbi:MAG: helix-turn-helix domain-containing protein [FCB group bacterium]|nr:helix-turn-helix domain-containing protein [FCB group bacterium]
MSELQKKFGALLKLERERKNIKLDDLAQQLKISKTNLEYIEQGDSASLPSELYFNLFAKSYAESLGIDYTRTIEAIKEDLGDFQNTSETTSEEKHIERKLEEEISNDSEKIPEDKRLIKKFISLIIGIIIIFILFLIVNKLFLSKNSEPVANTKETEQQKQIPTPKANESTNESPKESYNWTATQIQKPEKIKLSFVAKDQCWATVLADGDTVIFRNLIPDKQYQVEAKYRLLVSIGIPSLVSVKLNGQPVNLINPTTKRISRVEINQTNLDSFFHPKVTINKTTNRPKINTSQNQSKTAIKNINSNSSIGNKVLDSNSALPLDSNKLSDDTTVNEVNNNDH